MRGFWSESNWRLDHAELVLPNGQRIALKQILQQRVDLIEGRADLPAKWSGWRVRQQWLIAPGGTLRRGRIAQHVLHHVMHMSEWEQNELSRRQLALF
jgi:hypothetical protein